ncbi:glutathione peroxidase [Parvibium lacunae]|uniref:Glutathione peroxidase n=1 Tax=Parvibium lacunae TaxID=1888893 RepID=A0A368L205_9BURK|nr:glutathione peroxidase [Parvibium lacunae]RCS57142.1 glutathione peroxidase [Parvibium lacunae]
MLKHRGFVAGLVFAGLATLPAATWAAGNTTSTAPACPALLNTQLPRLQDEQPQALCQYAGKVLLIVNTASYCGFTGQYKGLEALYAKYKDQGLVVLGFPSNEFGQQEPANNKAIADFCENTYGVKFPMFAKSAVTGSQANPVYRQLIARTGKSPSWNFYKYLVNRQGEVIDTFSSLTGPENRQLIRAVEQALKSP